MGKISLSNIAEELAVRNGLTREAADNFMHVFIETIEKGLQEDGMVKVKGLGTFKVQEMSDRDSVDVNTGDRITIKGYRKVTFTPDSAMKELVNRPFAHFEPTELNDGYPAEEEVVTSEVLADENESNETTEEEIVEISVEKTPEETRAEELLEAVAETQIEVVAEETAETAAGETIEAIEEISETTIQDEVMKEDVSVQVLKKRRGRGCRLTLFAFVAILAILFGWIIFMPKSDEILYEEDSEEYKDIVVKSNLEEELGTEWGDELKAERQLPIEKEETPTASEGQSDSVTQADQQTGDTVQEASIPVAVENANPKVEEPKTPVAEDNFCAVTLTESLKAKAIKDITPADTTDYTMNGTFVVHELKRGETIIQLANMYYGDKRLWPYIVKYNRMEDFNNVAIGQMVNIPVLRNNR